MAFPVVAAVNGGNHSVDVGSPFQHTVNLPSGIASGDLLLVLFSSDGSGETFSYPAGWNEMVLEGGSGFTCNSAWRKADGTEGSTILVTLTSAEQSCHTSFRITGYFNSATEGDFIQISTVADGTSVSPNANPLNPANWDVEDTLWIAWCTANGTVSPFTNVTAYPTDYTDGRTDLAENGNGVTNGTASRNNAVASEDTGAFTIDVSTTWRAFTIAIRPAAAAAGRGPYQPWTLRAPVQAQ